MAAAIELRRLRHYAGCAHGLRHPSVAMQLLLSPGWESPWHEAAGRVGAESHGVQARADAEPAMRLAWALVALQRDAGWVLSPVVHLSGAADSRVLAVPTLPGRAAITVKAAEAWLRWFIAPDDLEAQARLEAVRTAMARQAPPGKNNRHLLAAALAHDIPWVALSDNCLQFGWGTRRQRLDSTFTERTSAIASSLARTKPLAARVMRRAGLPVPDHQLAGTEAQALAVAHRLGWPVVVKPTSSDGGNGVTPAIDNDDALRHAFRQAAAFGSPVMVERHVDGQDYRITVFDGRAVWVTLRLPGGVTGDGTSDVATLLARTNADPRRSSPRAALAPIADDTEVEAMLQAQGLSRHSVPAAGRFVRLRRASNTALGGEPVAAFDGAHADNLLLAEQAAAALGLDVAGIDVLMPDIRTSWRQAPPGAVGICEINAQPQLGFTTQQHLHGLLLRRRVAGDGRIPVVVIAAHDAAARGRAAWTALAARDPVAAARVGVASSDGAVLGGVELGRCKDVYAACEALIDHRGVHALLVLADDLRLVATGLPVDRVDLFWLAGIVSTPARTDGLLRVLASRRQLLVNAADPAAIGVVERYQRADAVAGIDVTRQLTDEQAQALVVEQLSGLLAGLSQASSAAAAAAAPVAP